MKKYDFYKIDHDNEEKRFCPLIGLPDFPSAEAEQYYMQGHKAGFEMGYRRGYDEGYESNVHW